MIGAVQVKAERTRIDDGGVAMRHVKPVSRPVPVQAYVYEGLFLKILHVVVLSAVDLLAGSKEE